MYALFSYLHTYMLSSDIKRANPQNTQNRIPLQLFEKWHNLSYCYVSYAKSETSDISRTGALFLKSFLERVEENHIYNQVKPNSAVKTRTVYRGCDVCYQVF